MVTTAPVVLGPIAVAIPEGLTDIIPTGVLLQLPPVDVSINCAESPSHICVIVPVIGLGFGFTDTVYVALQPVVLSA